MVMNFGIRPADLIDHEVPTSSGFEPADRADAVPAAAPSTDPRGPAVGFDDGRRSADRPARSTLR